MSFEKFPQQNYEKSKEEKETNIALSPEKIQEIRDKWHTIEGVKDYLSERMDIYSHLSRGKYSEEGLEVGLEKSKKYLELSKSVDKEDYEKPLRALEQELGDGLSWREEEQKSVFVGETDLKRHRYGFNYPEDLQNMPEDKYKQDRLRAMVDVLTDKEYEKRGKELKPTTYEEISTYLNELMKGWSLEDDDSSVIALKKNIENKDYKQLLDQADVCSGKHIRDAEAIKAGDRNRKKMVEKNLHTGHAIPALNAEIENLRRYRKFLYSKLENKQE